MLQCVMLLWVCFGLFHISWLKVHTFLRVSVQPAGLEFTVKLQGMWFPKLYAQAFVIVLNVCAEKEVHRPLMSDLQAGIHNLFPLNKVLSRDVGSLRKLAQKQCPFESESEDFSSSSFV